METQSRVDLKLVDCRLAVLDSPLGDKPVFIPCPNHQDDTPSFGIFPDHAHCFNPACGLHISRRMETLAFLLKISVNEAIKIAAKYSSEAVDGYRERVAQQVRTDPLPKSYAAVYNHSLYFNRRPRLEWLYDRGLNDEWIERACLGHDSTRFTIPFWNDKRDLITIRYRQDPFYGEPGTLLPSGVRIPKYCGMTGRNGLFLYPEWLIAADKHDYIVVCEGEFDALRLWMEGIPACSPTNGAGNVKHMLKLLEPYERIKELYIATDQDEAGETAATELAVLAFQHGLKTTRLTWPRTWGKDVSELYTGGHTVNQAGASQELPVVMNSH